VNAAVGLSLLAVAGLVALGGLLALTLGGLRRTVESRLAASDAELRRLVDAGHWRERGDEHVRLELASFRGAVEQLAAREHERRAREEEGWAVLHRVASVLTGSQRTGRTGENVLREALGSLPPSMMITDFRVNGRVVEFGLILSDGRRLPIDSKWPAEAELVSLSAAESPEEREPLIRAIERAVAERAKEVGGYRDPAITTPFAVAAIPDAAYAVLRRAHADAYRSGVIVVAYSLALPMVLFIHSMATRLGGAGDVEACVAELGRTLDAIEGTLENKVARASTMLSNGAEELRARLGKARGSLARAGDDARASDGEAAVRRMEAIPGGDELTPPIPRLVG
jgi:hypothetical protein